MNQASRVFSHDAAATCARHPNTVAKEVERLLAMHLETDHRQLVVTWTAARRGQPGDDHERLPWQPGTDLPEGTLYLTCQAVRPDGAPGQ